MGIRPLSTLEVLAETLLDQGVPARCSRLEGLRVDAHPRARGHATRQHRRVRGQGQRELRRDVDTPVAANLLLAAAASLFQTREAPDARACEQTLSLLLRGQLAAKPRLKWTPAAPTLAP